MAHVVSAAVSTDWPARSPPAAERLHPVVHGMLAEIFGDDLPPEPERTPLSVIHTWVP